MYGSSSFTSSDYTFGTWLRQQGKQLFTADGLGFELALRMQQQQAIPPATVGSEEAGLPTATGKAADGRLWYKESQFFSVSAKTEHPAEAAKLIDFLVNSSEAVGLLGTDRGVPPNLDARASIEADLEPGEQQVFDYLAAIEPELGPAPPPPPAGASKFADTLKRFGQEVLFQRLTPQQAGQAMVDELNQGM